jgi:hypothetical protein
MEHTTNHCSVKRVLVARQLISPVKVSDNPLANFLNPQYFSF